jgi:predicted NBD/HSP70 family sugar kinase
VGISVNEEKTMLALTDLRGEVLGYEEVTEHNELAELPAAIRASFTRTLKKSGVARNRVRGAGIAVAGIVDPDEGICRYSAGLDWRDVPIAKDVAAALKLPSWTENDANAIAMGEKIFGRGREYDNFSSIMLGRTIGSAHYVNGMLYRGHDGSAGEIGHITVDPNGPLCRCGRNGCLDMLAGGYALRQAAKHEGLSITNMRDLEELAVHGDGRAVTLLRNAGKALGSAVATLVHLNNPAAVLFTDLEGFENGVFRTATRQAIENGILPRFLGSTQIVFGDGEPVSLPRSAASIAAFNYLIAL